MSESKTNNTRGFTIVELLIVIVVIAILATITIIGFNGIQGRAHDTAIKNDFKNIAKQFELYKVDNGVYPVGDAELGAIGIKVSKSAYDNGMVNNAHNLLYCRVAADGPNKFALIAGSKSGNILTYKSESGAVTSTDDWWHNSSSQSSCRNADINQADAYDRDLFYYQGSWRPYVN